MLNRQAQVFAAAVTVHLQDEDFPKFAEPLIQDMMNDGDSDQTIVEALFDGMQEALKDIEAPSFSREDFIRSSLSSGVIVDMRAAHNLKKAC